MPQPLSKPILIHTDGGSLVDGDVNIATGDFIGRDKITHIYPAEEAYDVRGLPNPYLGLRCYTYYHSALYAGRAKTVISTVKLLTDPGEQRTLIFITGASGSGKSSFVQAGLLPALEQHYSTCNLAVRWAVFRPSRQPLAGLADALTRLGLPADGPLTAARPFLTSAPTQTELVDQISLLVIDQFEELFTQSEPSQRDILFTILESLPSFAEQRLHIIATLRVDYLPDLFIHEILYNIAKQGIDLRVMSVEEIEDAIQRPLQQVCPNAERRFEEMLLKKLAYDAAIEATYLPLLQVSLEDIWRRGNLSLGAYSNLTDAIRNHAEDVYHKTSNQYGQIVERTQMDQETILRIFLDLVEVSLDDNNLRDVRCRRTLKVIMRKDANRKQLIEELIEHRLLSKSLEPFPEFGEDTEVVDIIHESLIGNWARLQNAIKEQRNILQQRTRFEHALDEWLSKNRDEGYLIDGVRLAEAISLNRAGDVALQSFEAKQMLKYSVDRYEERRRRQLRRTQIAAILLGLFLIAALVAIQVALNAQEKAQVAIANERGAREDEVQQRYVAETREAEALDAQTETQRQSKLSLGRQLAAQAITSVDRGLDAELSLLLAVEAVKLFQASNELPSQHLDDALRRALAAAPNMIYRFEINEKPYSNSFEAIYRGYRSIKFSASGRYLLSYWGNVVLFDSRNSLFRLIDLKSRTVLTGLEHITTPITAWGFNSDETVLSILSTEDKTYQFEVARGQLLRNTSFTDVKPIRLDGWGNDEVMPSDVITFGEPGNYINIKNMRNISNTQSITVTVPDGMYRVIQFVKFTPNGDRVIVAADSDAMRPGALYIWNTENGELITSATHLGSIIKAIVSPDGAKVVTLSSSDRELGGPGTAYVWNANSGGLISILRHISIGGILDIEFSPDGSLLVTSGLDNTVRVWNTEMFNEALNIRPASLNIKDVTYDPFSLGTANITAKIQNSKVLLVDTNTGKKLGTFSHKDTVSRVSFYQDKYFASVLADKTTHIWDIKTGKEIIVIPEEIEMFSISGNGKRLMTLFWAIGFFKVWDIEHNRQVTEIDLKKGGLAIDGILNFNGTRAVIFQGVGFSRRTSRSVTLWDIDENQELVHIDTATSAQFSPNNALLATIGIDGTAHVIDARTGQILEILPHESEIQTLDFSPNSSLLATGSLDGTVHIWYIMEGQEIAILNHDTEISNVKFSEDGKRIRANSAIFNYQSTTNYEYIWIVSIDELVASACQILTRNFTKDEWSSFIGDTIQFHETCTGEP